MRKNIWGHFNWKRAQWLRRPWLDQSSKDHWPHQVVWSALRVMVIACVKRQAFKLPLPSYTNGARAMERRYNGPHIKWHLSEGRGRERLGWSEGGRPVKAACWSFQIHDRNVINPKNGLRTARSSGVWLWKVSVTMQNVSYVSQSPRWYLTEPIVCWPGVFLKEPAPLKRRSSPVPLGPHHRRTSWGPRVLLFLLVCLFL